MMVNEISPPVDRSSDGKDWGHDFWILLQAICFYYPDRPSNTRRLSMQTLMSSVPQVLVCNTCKTDFHDYLQKNPPSTESGADLFRWVVDAHNSVNTRIGKPVMSLQEAIAKTSHLSAEEIGRASWNALHHVAFHAPKQTSLSRDYQNFFLSLAYQWPFESWRQTYRAAMLKYPITQVSNPEQWLVQIHNMVSMTLFKPTVDYRTAHRWYNRAPRCGNPASSGSGSGSGPGSLWDRCKKLVLF
jgi:hypothetical protein